MPTPTTDIDQIVASFQATPEYLAATGIRDQFFDRIADLLTIHAIGSIVPAALPVGALLGIFEFKQLPADPAIFQVAARAAGGALGSARDALHRSHAVDA